MLSAFSTGIPRPQRAMDTAPPATSSRSTSKKNTRQADKDKAPATPTAPRPPTYKEKFQKLRERYDQVTTAREDYKKQLDAANAKIKELDAENALLLDTIQADRHVKYSNPRYDASYANHPPPLEGGPTGPGIGPGVTGNPYPSVGHYEGGASRPYHGQYTNGHSNGYPHDSGTSRYPEHDDQDRYSHESNGRVQ
ncbi:hypothetical protein BDN72DRAFT_857931 [Pluteus cervinus]|uniref:Uncharacterized protein n=1 Tax=Pluteus cervinus TaxID=181527 RepID=A0ACD3AUQ9_9AGAR|nr:hypothetical protein BDN72DRAFT_857931 [Pluteus cervinus]